MFIVKQNIALNQTVTIVSCYCGLLFHNITFYCTMSRSYMTEALRGSCADFVKSPIIKKGVIMDKNKIGTTSANGWPLTLLYSEL